MNIVSFVSFKGGAGKTTSLQVLASVLLAKGRKVALVESDENRPLTQWRVNARALGTWDEGCEIYPGDTVDQFLGSVVAAEKTGAEFLLIDTQGGGSELNNAVVVNSSIVVVPTAITAADVPRCVDTLEFIAGLRETEEIDDDQVIAILVTRFPLSLNKSRESSLAKLGVFPMFETILRERDALAGLEEQGMLHLALARRAAEAPILATHFRSAMREGDQLADEILEVLEA